MEVDDILEEIGQSGPYQAGFLALLLLIDIQTSFFPISFVFTASELQYRCLIPECESQNNATYDNPESLRYIPLDNGNPSKCFRYRPLDSNHIGNCSSNNFMTNVTDECAQMVFSSERRSIASDYDLLCEENRWKLSAVGTTNNLAQFAGFLTMGIISDKYGRKLTLIGALLLSTFFGVMRSYANDYFWFMFFESADAAVSTGVFTATYILAMEILGTDKRLLGGVLLQCFYAVGQTLLGIVAWKVNNWRTFLRILYYPGVIFIAYFWLMPESIRWLFVNRRFDEAVKILEKIGKVNKKPLTAKTKHNLLMLKTKVTEGKDDEAANKMLASTMSVGKEEELHPIKTSLKSRIIFIRLIVCSYCWMTNIFVYAGLSLNSVYISGDQHLNFILTSFVEIPANILMSITLNRYGRKGSQLGSFILAGVSLLAFSYIPTEMVALQLVLYLIGKIMITISFSVMYVYFSELFPTNARNTLMATCALFSRIGSVSAPSTPLLSPYVNPILVFAISSLLGGLSVLLLPETKNSGLPDTLQDAERIGKKY